MITWKNQAENFPARNDLKACAKMMRGKDVCTVHLHLQPVQSYLLVQEQFLMLDATIETKRCICSSNATVCKARVPDRAVRFVH